MKTSKGRHLTEYQKKRREKAWAILRDHQAAVAWDPHFVDVALNHIPHDLTFAGLCRSTHQRLRGTVVTQEELLHPDGSLMLDWLQQEVTSKLMPGLQEDGVYVLYDLVRKAVADFQPTVSSGASWSTQGFLAYLLLRAKRLFDWASDAYAQQASESTPVMEESRLSLPCTEFDLRPALIGALGKCIDSPLMWDCLETLAYRRVSLRDFARHRGIPRTTLSRTIISPFIQRLRTHLLSYYAAPLRRTPTDMKTVAEGVAGCFSPEEFRALVPRPQ